MERAGIVQLFDYSYWANAQILRAAEALSPDGFMATSDITYRGVRATLVHSLDVERSWRLRLIGEPPEVWDVELAAEDFPDLQRLSSAWHDDELEMRAWVDGLENAALHEVVDLGPRDRFPLEYFLLHIITHSAQQRRDVVILLEQAGHSPPEIEFLNYADSLAG